MNQTANLGRKPTQHVIDNLHLRRRTIDPEP